MIVALAMLLALQAPPVRAPKAQQSAQPAPAPTVPPGRTSPPAGSAGPRTNVPTQPAPAPLPAVAPKRFGRFDLDQPNTISRRILDTQARTDWGVGVETAPSLAGTLPDGRLLAVHWSAPVDGSVLTAQFLPDTRWVAPSQNASLRGFPLRA